MCDFLMNVFSSTDELGVGVVRLGNQAFLLGGFRTVE